MSSSRTHVQNVASVNLTFGLDWFALLGASMTREARRIARQHRASHMVVSGDDTSSVGLAALKNPRKAGAVLYSAAQLLAQRFASGTVAMVLQLDGQRWWVVAIHEGAVVARTDQLFATAEEAWATVQQLRQAYPALELLGEALSAPSLSDLASGVLAQAALRRTAQGLWRLPTPLLGLAITLAATALLPGIFDRADALRKGAHSDVSPVTPEEAWRAALSSAGASRWVHGIQGTQQILQSFYGLPVHLEGWRLSTAECHSEHSHWECAADYERSNIEASNEGFVGAARPEWRVSFTPLSSARIHWTHDAQGVSADRAVLNTTAHNERQLFSRLQAIHTATTSISIAGPKSLPVVSPDDGTGQSVPRPPGLRGLRTRGIEVRAPLRSASLLLPNTEAVGWQRVALQVDSQVRPSLKNSRIAIILQGVLYETD